MKEKSPFQKVTDDLTSGDGCVCHTGTGYNTSCEHCRGGALPTYDELRAMYMEAVEQQSTIQSLTEDNAELRRIAEQATERGMEYLEERDQLLATNAANWHRADRLQSTVDTLRALYAKLKENWQADSAQVEWQARRAEEAESTIDKLQAAYARLAERLRLATPQSLYAQTEQDIELQSTVDTLKVEVGASRDVIAAARRVETDDPLVFLPIVSEIREALTAYDLALSSTENREPE